MICAIVNEGYLGQISQHQFEIDYFHIADRIDTSVHVDNVRVIKTAHDMYYSIAFANVGQKLVSKTLSFACTLDDACNIDKLHGCWYNLDRVADFAKNLETRVWDWYDTYVWLDRTKWEISGLRLDFLHQGIEKRRLANIWKTHYSGLKFCSESFA